MQNDQSCDICFKIMCRQCKWEATDEEVKKITEGLLTACPVCGWQP